MLPARYRSRRITQVVTAVSSPVLVVKVAERWDRDGGSGGLGVGTRGDASGPAGRGPRGGMAATGAACGAGGRGVPCGCAGSAGAGRRGRGGRRRPPRHLATGRGGPG